MRLLVLGGTHFVGRAVVETALARGDSVTTVTRGASGPPAAGAAPIYVDRSDRSALAAVLGDGAWDAVIDTWSGAPRVVRDAAELLTGRAAHYGLVSSRSVYRWPIRPGLDEAAPVVDGDPDSESAENYAAAKRGGEVAAVQSFGGPVLVARAGLILGPYEDVGRLPWWLRRLERGGHVLAPGPPDRPLQYIDARDLAVWMLKLADRRRSGAFNAVSKPGHGTMETLLEAALAATGSAADLIWVDPTAIESAGVAAWTQLPVWAPPTGELAGLHDGDVTAAYRAGLTCRPVAETVADTWRWLLDEGDPKPRFDRPPVGLDPVRERTILDALHRQP
jgi:nucleoside-diphosphate-sugar epimerase